MDILLFTLVFGATALLVLAGLNLRPQQGARQRLDRLSNRSTGRVASKFASARSAMAKKESRRLFKWLAKLGGSAARTQVESAGPLRQRLIYAGFRRDSAVSVYMGVRIVLALLLPLVVLLTPRAWSMDEWKMAASLCGATGVGYLLPSWLIDRLVNRRKQKIVLALPDALDLMVVCVEAGFGINASLARVAKEFATSHPVLSTELELVSLEIRAGKSTIDALNALALRTGVSDIRSLVALLVQTERFGTSIADALRVHSDSMRVQRMQRAEEEAGKAPLKMIFPTVVIFAATLIVLLWPALYRFDGMFEK
jgi:tight adherence protein C